MGEDGHVELACFAARFAAVASAPAGGGAVAFAAAAAVPATSVARSSAALAASPACSLVARAVLAAVAEPDPTAGNVRRMNHSTNSVSLSVSTAFKFFLIGPTRTEAEFRAG